MARQSTLVLPNLEGMGFVPVEIEASARVPQLLTVTSFCTIYVIKGEVTIRLDMATPAHRIAGIAPAIAP